MTAPVLPQLLFSKPAEWRRWLDKHQATAPGALLQFAKQSSDHTSISYPEAVEVALCYGWIDGQSKRLDDDFWLQRFTPRRPQSIWSRINREKALALIERGLMHPAGLAAIEQAKANGRWDAAYEPASTSPIPADLQAALDANPAARDFFATLSGQNRYAILFRLQTAKRPATRATRLAKFVAMLARKESLH